MTLKLLSLLISSFWLVQNLILPTTILAVETCPPGENRYRPGGNCEKESPQPAHSEIDEYPLSCIPASNLTYTQTTNDPNQIPSQVTVTLNVDLTNAELGGFGPDSNTISTTSPDILSQKYPFNALFDKPPNTSPFNSRESFRTWWRLLSVYQQANAKAIYLTQANQGKINNMTYEFYNSQDKLKQWEIKKLYNKLPNCLRKSPVCSDFLEKYQNLNTDTQEAYDALMPFNFDNLKTFLVLDNSVITENIPFLNAINTGVNDPNTGLIYTLSPSWTQTDITNNIVLINNKGENQQLLIDKADNFNCPAIPKDKLTHLPAPKTFPTPTYLTQQVTFKDLTIAKEQTGTESECKGANYCIGLNQTTCNSYSACTWISEPKYQYTITGQGEGDPVVIFNHPFVKNIENSIVSGNTSLFKMLLPNFAQIPEERTIDAPKSTFTASSPYPNSSVSVTTSNGSSDMPIYRKTALIKDSLCQLQNMWLIPAGLQRSNSCGDNLETPTITPTPSTCKMHLFENTCSNQVCHKTVISQAKNTSCNSKVLNPYYAIAIALNESGGLMSINKDGSNIKHFGCDPFGATGIGFSIEEKLSCMTNTLRNDCVAGKTDTQTLAEYGYQPGNNLENLINILGGPNSTTLFVSPSQASTYDSTLTQALQTKDVGYWTIYYQGFIDNFCTTP